MVATSSSVLSLGVVNFLRSDEESFVLRNIPKYPCSLGEDLMVTVLPSHDNRVKLVSDTVSRENGVPAKCCENTNIAC